MMALSQISAIFLLLCIALSGCEAQLPSLNLVGDVLNKAKEIVAGKVAPDIKTFSVVDNGAKPDGTTDSSMAFIKTFKDACNANANAMMVIPTGDFIIGPVLFSGPCTNPSPLIIQANGVVKAFPDIEHFKGGAEASDWITFQNIKGLIITGTGTFHGQAAEVWKGHDCAGSSTCQRLPASLKFIKVSDAVIYGIKSIDPKGFHFMISWVQNMKISNVNLEAPDLSPNTDGFHMSKSSNVDISDCVIGTGDDCVSIIQGSTNINVSNTACGPGHGFSIGSLGHYEAEQDVSGITFKNCTMTRSDNGCRIKTYKTQTPSKASGILFQDITMTEVHNPIIITQEYGDKKGPEPSKVSISDVSFVNIIGTSASKNAVTFLCSASNPCEGIKMNNVDLKYAGPPNQDKEKPFAANCTNAKVTYTGPQNPPACTAPAA